MSETPPIVPRWEWRTFGGPLDAVKAELRRWDHRGDSESDEQYLLTDEGDNVKIRDELLDIKVLREVDQRGLERWEPTLKASFPLDASTLAVVFEALREPLPELARQAYSQDHHVRLTWRTARSVSPVHKRRVRYTPVHGWLSISRSMATHPHARSELIDPGRRRAGRRARLAAGPRERAGERS
jgi:exopolyphosphatase/guanosine-5'-triphosphate,3'-diphosphate pyrophosphatase